MHQPLYAILAAVLLSTAISPLSRCRAETPRFYRLLKLYRNPIYRVEERDARLDIDYSSHGENNEGGRCVSDSCDRVQTLDREADGAVGLDVTRQRGDSLRVRGYSHATDISGSSHTSSYVRSNELIDRSDIDYYNESSVRARTVHDITWQRYFKRRRRGYRCIELDAEGTVQMTGTRTREYEEYALSLLDTLDQTEYAWLGEGILDIDASYGVGRPTPVTPLIRALEVERGLLETGVINGQLSDSVLIALAHWLATEFVHGIEHDLPDKFFYAALDSLLSGVEGFNRDAVSGEAVMRVREAVDWSYPFLEHGLRLRAGLFLNVYVTYDDTRTEPPSLYSFSSGIQLDQDNGLLLEASYLWALTPRLFLDVGAEWGSQYGAQLDWTNDLFAKALFQVQWNAGVYLIITNRVLVEAYMRDLPADIVWPRDWPREMGVRFDFFVEDRIRLSLGIVKEHYDSERYRGVPDEREDRESITLGVGYDF